MKIFYKRPALALAWLGALIGLGNIIMSTIYHTEASLDIRVITGWVTLLTAVDIVALIVKHFYGGSDD